MVRRLIEQVISADRLDLIDELYAPAMAAGAHRWTTSFLESFPDVPIDIVELIASMDFHPVERTSNPSSTATTSTPASASCSRKPSMSEPVCSGSA